MKAILLLLLTCFFSSIYAQSKDSLSIDVKGTTANKIIVKFFLGKKNITLKPESDKLEPGTESWKIRLNSDKDVHGIIYNSEADTSSVTLLPNQTYFVSHDSLIESSLVLDKNIAIDILDNQNQKIATYQFSYSSNNTRDKKPNPGNFDPDYKVGSAIYDALTLADKGKKIANKATKAKILLYYTKNSDATRLVKEYADNPFLDSIARSVSGAEAQAGGFKLSSIISAIGGVDVTTLADGAAKFIVKRAKQELSIAFFEKFKKTIDSFPDIQTVFPETANLLNEIDEDIYDYERYIQNLREAFKKDITTIHRNLPGIIDNHPVYFSIHQYIKAALLSACYTAQQLEDNSHPADIIADYPVDYLDSLNKNYKGAIQTIQLLSESLKDTSSEENANYWVSIKRVREVVNDKDVFKIYLGLLFEEAKNKFDSIHFNNTTLLQLLKEVAVNYDKNYSVYNSYRSYVLRFGEKTDALNAMIKDNHTANASDSSTIEKYAKYFRSSVDLLNYCTEASRLPVINKAVPDLKKLFDKYFKIAYSTADLTVDINRRNYSASINDALHIYNLVCVRPEKDETVVINKISKKKIKTKEEKEVEKNVNVNSTVNSDILLNANIETTDEYSKSVNDTTKRVLTNLVRYGSFMASVATAKNSDDVENAIESAALPVGSSRIKRVSDFNVSLNSYAGLFYGMEKIKDVDAKWKTNVFGITAPIGVSLSRGHSLLFIKTGKSEWSTSLFLSLVDLGAVAAFRFKDDSTAQIPTVRLKNIFSPGLFISTGIPKTPLSINIGKQMGPNLRKVNKDVSAGNDFEDKVYWRWSVSVNVDIPIFNFYTKSK